MAPLAFNGLGGYHFIRMDVLVAFAVMFSGGPLGANNNYYNLTNT